MGPQGARARGAFSLRLPRTHGTRTSIHGFPKAVRSGEVGPPGSVRCSPADTGPFIALLSMATERSGHFWPAVGGSSSQGAVCKQKGHIRRRSLLAGGPLRQRQHYSTRECVGDHLRCLVKLTWRPPHWGEGILVSRRLSQFFLSVLIWRSRLAGSGCLPSRARRALDGHRQHPLQPRWQRAGPG